MKPIELKVYLSAGFIQDLIDEEDDLSEVDRLVKEALKPEVEFNSKI